MRIPHFLTLAQLDEQHFANACRHGIVHLTWGRVTARFTRDEFRQLADLLAKIAHCPHPIWLHEGELLVRVAPGEEGEVRIGPLAFHLAYGEFQQFAQTVQLAAQHLDSFLASGVWEREEPEDATDGVFEPLRRSPFSLN
jgi:hypothetical protein